MPKVHNLDVGVSEYFEFTTGGHTYKFRHLNTEEMKNFRLIFKKAESEVELDAEEEILGYLMSFVEPVTDGAPEFSQVWQKMYTPQRNNFVKMVTAEFGADQVK